MDRWRADLEVSLHVSLGGRPTMQTRVRVDEGQILTLPGSEAWWWRRNRHQRVKCGSAARRSQRSCAVELVFAFGGDDAPAWQDAIDRLAAQGRGALLVWPNTHRFSRTVMLARPDGTGAIINVRSRASQSSPRSAER